MINRAKDLFYTYEGNHSAMANDGVYDEYKAYDVSAETESVWLSDIQKSEIEKISYSPNFKLSFVKACSFACRTQNAECVELLSEALRENWYVELDSSSKVYVCESFVDLLAFFRQNKCMPKYKMLVSELLESIKKEDSSDETLRKIKIVQKKISEI